VVSTDLATGSTTEHHLAPGEHVILCAEPAHLANAIRYPNGTTVAAIRRRTGNGIATPTLIVIGIVAYVGLLILTLSGLGFLPGFLAGGAAGRLLRGRRGPGSPT
jgi:hypothetical protein